MKVERIALADYEPAPYNPRVELEPEDEEWQAIANSLGTHGQIASMIVNRQTGHIVAGHQRAKILNAWGEQYARAVVVDVDETTEKAMNLAVNKISGDWDYGKLEQVVARIEEEDPTLAEATGFTPGEWDTLLGKLDDLFGFGEWEAENESEYEDGEEPVAPEDEQHEIIMSFDTLETAEAFLMWAGIDPLGAFERSRTVIVDGAEIEGGGR